MRPYYQDEQVTLHHGDCLNVLAELNDASVDSVVTDPPYGLNFMGKHWDTGAVAFAPAVWGHALRVLKPGGHLAAFGGTRTWHRLTVAIEDAGFEIRDSLAWLYGSGFPKSLDVSKAIDRARDDRADILRVTTWLADHADAKGITRADVDTHMGTSDMGGWWLSRLPHRCQCPKWEQWLQLKAMLSLPDDMDVEVWRLNGRKGTPGEAWDRREVLGKSQWSSSVNHFVPGEDHTQRVVVDITAPATDAAKQWQGWGTALKPAHEPIILARKPIQDTVAANVVEHGTGALNIAACRVDGGKRSPGFTSTLGVQEHSGSVSGLKTPRRNVDESQGRWPANVLLDPTAAEELDRQSGGEGDASRFFLIFRYTPKAPGSERPIADGVSHPTVKPLELMRWLVRLITPPGGVVLDPFAGTGTTAEAAIHEHKHAIVIERETTYLPLIVARLSKPMAVGFNFEEPA